MRLMLAAIAAVVTWQGAAEAQQVPVPPAREDTIYVQSTRTGRRIEDEPVRVEVLGREEIEEKMLMTPGDISMMLNETSGLRVQVTSPGLGGANVRIQGLRGRYTQLLSDGLPLYGGQGGALGLLQIPPMDLGQVEVIRGVASALYGGSALGGVVNLISRRPDGERELLLNQTTRGGTDAVLWLASDEDEGTGWTVLGSAHRQSQHDVNDDGWADLPGYRRAVVRPRVFLGDGTARSLFITAGATVEERDGGTLSGALTPAGTPHAEALDTRRLDAGLAARALVRSDRLVSARASAVAQRHVHRFGTIRERDLHATLFGEASLAGNDRGHTWVLGGALQRERYTSDDVPAFDYTHDIASVFVQDEVSPVEPLTLALSARLDAHSEYGTQFSPRLSVLLRPADEWNVRLAVGTGYFAPTPFTDETEVIGLSLVRPVTGLAVERATSASLDVGREFGDIEANITFFGSEVRRPVRLVSGAQELELVNAPEPTRTYGGDALLRYHAEPWHVTATYAHIRSTEHDFTTAGRRAVPLTPRHMAGIVGMWEAEDAARVGVELYYTGRQPLEDNPYRDTSRPFVIFGALAEWRVGPARLFVNAENLLDARQTRHDPLLLPARRDGRWTTDAWAPLEGRTFNGGIRLDF